MEMVPIAEATIPTVSANSVIESIHINSLSVIPHMHKYQTLPAIRLETKVWGSPAGCQVRAAASHGLLG